MNPSSVGGPGGSRGPFPVLRQVALDTTDARGLAEFYRQLLGWEYRTGDEPPQGDEPDVRGTDWLVLCEPAGHARVAFQQVPALEAATWPEGAVPQQLHLDLTVPSISDLETHRRRATDLGGRLLEDRAGDEAEPLIVLADPAGHPFCIFVDPDAADA